MSYPIHTTIGKYIVSTARFTDFYIPNAWLYETMIFTVEDLGHLGAWVEGFQERTNDDDAVEAQHQKGIDYASKL